MTNLDELKKVHERIQAAIESLGDAKRAAVLSRDRRAELDRAERILCDCNIGVESELKLRGVDVYA